MTKVEKKRVQRREKCGKRKEEGEGEGNAARTRGRLEKVEESE